MDAFFCIDKPVGITSFGVLFQMRKILGVKKIGHTGTLDPLASGCLLVATGAYTKLIPYFEKDQKGYDVIVGLDGESPSYDTETPIEYISPELQEKLKQDISFSSLQEICSEHFLGNRLQIPPSYSALKIDGKRAFARARAGQEIEMKAREVVFYETNLLSYEYPYCSIQTRVSAGTYIRSLCHDLGEILGGKGYMKALRRTSIGALDLSSACLLEDLSWEKALGLDTLFPERIYELHDEQIYTRLRDGQRIRADFSFPQDKEIFLSDGKNIRYVVEYKGDILHPRKKVT